MSAEEVVSEEVVRTTHAHRVHFAYKAALLFVREVERALRVRRRPLTTEFVASELLRHMETYYVAERKYLGVHSLAAYIVLLKEYRERHKASPLAAPMEEKWERKKSRTGSLFLSRCVVVTATRRSCRRGCPHR